MTTMWMRAICAVLGSLSTACTTPGGPLRPHRAATPPRADVITALQLSREETDDSLLAVLRRSRPGFLRSRGSDPLLSVDGGPLTELSLLALIQASTVAEVRLVRAPSPLDCCRAVLLVQLGPRQGRIRP